MIVMGLRWMISDEPWMLDKIANAERLGISFKELFEPHINSTLPDYLKQIYRFFGLWVLTIGLFIISFSRVALEIKSKIWLNLLFCTGFMIYSAQYLAYLLIPSSHFIYLGWISIVLHTISVWNYRNN